MKLRLGDGDEGKTDTLGGGPWGGQEFTTGAIGNLFLGQKPQRHQDTLLQASAPTLAPPKPAPVGPAGGDEGDGGDGAASSSDGTAGSGNDGGDGDGP